MRGSVYNEEEWMVYEQYRQEHEPVLQEPILHCIDSDDEVDDAYAFNAVFGFWCKK